MKVNMFLMGCLLCGFTSLLWANPMPPDEFVADNWSDEKVEISYQQGCSASNTCPHLVSWVLRAEAEITRKGSEPGDFDYIVHRIFELTEGDPLVIDGDFAIDSCVAPGTYVYLALSYDSIPNAHAPNHDWVEVGEHGVSCPSSGRELDMTNQKFHALEGVPNGSPDYDFTYVDNNASDVDNNTSEDDFTYANDQDKKDDGGCSLTVL